jgi:hypothetical protein
MKMSKATLLIFSLIVLTGLSTPSAASLFGLFGKKQPVQEQAPQFIIHDEDSFKANTSPYHEIPFNDPKFEYDILLPKDWTIERIAKATPSTDQSIPEDITRFKSPMLGTAQAVMTIQAMRLDHEISVENWLKNYIYTNGYTLQDKINSLGNKKAGTSYISVFETKGTYTYTVAQINGNIIMIARFEVPLALKEPLAFLQKRTIDSFRLIMPVEESVEPKETFRLADALKISYPKSWQLRYPDLKDEHNMSVQIYNETQDQKVEGMIRFVAVSRGPQTNLAKETEGLKKYFGDFMGLEFKKMISSDKAPAYSRFLFSRYETYLVGSKKINAADRELRLAVLGDKDWYIFAFLLTPTESDNLYAWARNTETFDLIVKDFR